MTGPTKKYRKIKAAPKESVFYETSSFVFCLKQPLRVILTKVMVFELL